MKIRSVIICFFLVGSLFAQTKNSSPEVLAKPQAAPESTAPTTPPKIDAAKEADIRRLMDLEGTRTSITEMMVGMEKSMKPLIANALPPGEYREKLIDLFFVKFNSKASPQHMLDMAVPAYDKYYTHEEIKGLIRFYETPLGQKMASVQPKMSSELQEAGQKWGEGLGRDSMVEVLAEHPDLAKAMEAAAKGTQP